MQDPNRRSVMGMLSAAAASVALVENGILAPASAAEEKFVWAATGGAWSEQLTSSFVKGTKFAAGTTTQSAQLESIAASKILSANGAPEYSASNHGNAEVALLQAGSALQPYDLSVVTNFADIRDSAKIGTDYAAFCLLIFGLAWNTKNATKPASYMDMWKPEYKGRIGVPAYGYYGMYWLHALNKVMGGTEDDVTPALKLVSKLVREQQAVMIENSDHTARLFEQGEVVLAPWWSGRIIRLKEAGQPIGFEYVPGTLAVGSGFVVPKGAPQPRLANEFVNSTLDPQRQAAFAALTRYPPTNKKTVLDEKYKDVALPESAEANFVKLDWAKISATRAKNLELWNKEVL
jgi:putative spermidine/putrescine transport system substrate-binding protein